MGPKTSVNPISAPPLILVALIASLAFLTCQATGRLATSVNPNWAPSGRWATNTPAEWTGSNQPVGSWADLPSYRGGAVSTITATRVQPSAYRRPSWRTPSTLTAHRHSPVRGSDNWRSASLSSSLSTSMVPQPQSTTPSPLPMTSSPMISLRERCAQLNLNDGPVLSYVSGLEALTGNIQELDEEVQRMDPAKSWTQTRCQFDVQLNATHATSTQQPSLVIDSATGLAPSSSQDSSLLMTDTTATVSSDELVARTTVSTVASEPTTSSGAESTASGEYASTEIPAVLSTTETFFDVPTRQRRESDETPAYGMPSTSSENVESSTSLSNVEQDTTSEDLAKASSDLRALRKELNVAAEWLRQTNHTVHSAMFRALQAYVTSIERRVEHQRQLYIQTKSLGLKDRVAVIREKVANLLGRLKTMIPFVNQADVVDVNRVSSTGTSTPQAVPVSISSASLTSSSGSN